MHIVTIATLLGDDELKAMMETLADFDMAIRTIAAGPNEPGRFELLDRDGAVVLGCAIRLEPLSQLRELLGIYLDGVLCPDETRH